MAEGTILLIGRLLLAGTFGVAAAGKLADLRGSRTALAEFGVPVRAARTLGVLLPLAEAAIAVALLVSQVAWWGALGALALLVCFVVGIGLSLLRGRRPECHCFGQLTASRAGPWTLGRNVALAAAAITLLALGAPGENLGPGPLDGLSSTEGALLAGALTVAIVLAVQGWLILHVLRQNGRLLLRIEALEAGAEPSAHAAAGLPIGSAVPQVDLALLDGGDPVPLRSLLGDQKPLLVLFTDPNCGPCADLHPEVERWHEDLAERFTILFVSRGEREANLRMARHLGIREGAVAVQSDWEVARAFGVAGTPSALFLLPSGVVGSPVAGGDEAIRALVETAVKPRPPQTILRGVSGGRAG